MIAVHVDYRRTDGRIRVHVKTDATYSPDIADDLARRAGVAVLTTLEASSADWAESLDED